MLGTTLITIGVIGIVYKIVETCLKGNDPVIKIEAIVKKTRLDTKKSNSIETYTYIVTFYIPELNHYIGLSVPQEQFDITMEKDCGILECKLKDKEFISWSLISRSNNNSAK